MLKRQSPRTVFLRTSFTRTIKFHRSTLHFFNLLYFTGRSPGNGSRPFTLGFLRKPHTNKNRFYQRPSALGVFRIYRRNRGGGIDNETIVWSSETWKHSFDHALVFFFLGQKLNSHWTNPYVFFLWLTRMGKNGNENNWRMRSRLNIRFIHHLYLQLTQNNDRSMFQQPSVFQISTMSK